MRFILVILTQLIVFNLTAQKRRSVQALHTGTNASFRGMSIPTDEVIWVSGSNGTIGKSVNGGKTWRFMVVPGFEKRDFRDIEAFDSSTAIAMVVDNPAYIIKTIDGGLTWKKTFERNMDGMFLDAMDFKNSKEGICIGDPLAIGQGGKKYFYVIRTFDGGDSWKEVEMYKMPPAQDEEAIFSASGTNIHFLDHPDFEYAFVTGGKISNLFMIGRENKPSKVINLPLNQGVASSGTFSWQQTEIKNTIAPVAIIKNQAINTIIFTGQLMQVKNGGHLRLHHHLAIEAAYKLLKEKS